MVTPCYLQEAALSHAIFLLILITPLKLSLKIFSITILCVEGTLTKANKQS